MLYQDYNASIRDIFKQVEGFLSTDWSSFTTMASGREKILRPSHYRRGLASRRRFQLGRPISRIRTANRRSRGDRGRGLEANRSRGRPKIQDRSTYLSEGGVHFLAADPFNSSIIDDLTFALDLEIHLIVCDPVTLKIFWILITPRKKARWTIFWGR